MGGSGIRASTFFNRVFDLLGLISQSHVGREHCNYSVSVPVQALLKGPLFVLVMMGVSKKLRQSYPDLVQVAGPGTCILAALSLGAPRGLRPLPACAPDQLARPSAP